MSTIDVHTLKSHRTMLLRLLLEVPNIDRERWCDVFGSGMERKPFQSSHNE
jgi:hypothetical protein